MNFWKKLFGIPTQTSCCNSCCSQQTNIYDLLHLTEEDVQTLKNLDERIVIGKVLEVTPHPDPSITKVRVTKTDLGNEKIEQILCGGVNLQAGFVVAVATIGAKLSPDFEIGVRKIANVESRGMICARSELGLSANGEQKGEIWSIPTELETKIGISIKSFSQI